MKILRSLVGLIKLSHFSKVRGIHLSCREVSIFPWRKSDYVDCLHEQLSLLTPMLSSWRVLHGSSHKCQALCSWCSCIFSPEDHHSSSYLHCISSIFFYVFLNISSRLGWFSNSFAATLLVMFLMITIWDLVIDHLVPWWMLECSGKFVRSNRLTIIN